MMQGDEERKKRTVGEDEKAETSGEGEGDDGEDGAAKRRSQLKPSAALGGSRAHKFLKMAGGTMALSPR